MTRKLGNRSYVAFFEQLTDEQHALISGVVEAIGQHTLNGGFLDASDFDATDNDLLWGMLFARGMTKDRVSRSYDATREAAWGKGRSYLEKNPRAARS